MKTNLFSIVGVLLLSIAGVLLSGTTDSASAQGFYISGRSLKDANGNNFYPRGVNNPNIWFDSQGYNVLTNLANRKTNCIRIVWQRSGSASRLDQIIQRCRDLKMIAMVELHDGTGSNDANQLINNANYYVRSDVLTVLKRHERYLLINIANEWSNYQKSNYDWREAYKRPITILRNAGLRTTLVVDLPNYAQNWRAGTQYGWDLINYDPRHNILFDVHMYAGFNDYNEIGYCIWDYWNANLPLVIGEFGYNYNNGNNNLGCRVDHRRVMQLCSDSGYGYIAWSTSGNDSSNAWLNLLDNNWSGTTWWGNEVFYNTQWSISNSANRASVYN